MSSSPPISNTYLRYAIDIAQHRFDPGLAIRTPGYPAILALTGYTITGSLIGVLMLQAASGAAIPVIAGAILRPISRWVAALTSAVMILSLTPFQFINRIHPDQLYVFMMVLVIAALICRWLLSGRRCGSISLDPVMSPGEFASTRGSGTGVGVPRPGGLPSPSPWPRCRMRCAVSCGHSWVSKIRARASGQKLHWATSILQCVYVERRLGGRVLDGNCGSGAKGEPERVLLKKSHQEEKVRLGGPQPPDEAYEHLFGRFRRRPGRAGDRDVCSTANVLLLDDRDFLSQQEWPDGDRILLRATLQHYWTYPWQLVRSALQTYRGLTLGPAWTFTLVGYGFDAIEEQPIFFEPVHRDKGIIPTPERQSVTAATLAMFANKAKPTPIWALWVRRVFAADYFVLVPVSYFLMVIGVVGFIRSSCDLRRSTSVVVFGLHSMNVLALSVLVDPQFRYQAQSIPLAIIGAGIGIYRLATIYRRRQAPR